MSYLRETERFDTGLPSISRSGIIDSSVRRGLTTIESNGYASRDPVFYQRPASPTHQRKYNQEVRHVLSTRNVKCSNLIFKHAYMNIGFSLFDSTVVLGNMR